MTTMVLFFTTVGPKIRGVRMRPKNGKPGCPCNKVLAHCIQEVEPTTNLGIGRKPYHHPEDHRDARRQ